MEQDKYEHARHNAQAWAEELIAMHAEYMALDDSPEPDEVDKRREEIEERAREMPLSVQVRTPWYTPGSEPPKPEEFEILLSTGGPALRIIGDLDLYGEAANARLEMQDWGVPWREAYGMDIAALLWFAGLFYFGE